MLRNLALIALLVTSFADVGIAEDVFWMRLSELTKTKGIPVNFKRAGETLGLQNSSNEYPSYQISYEEREGTAHHLTRYEDASKVSHLIGTSFDQEHEAYRLGHAYLVSPNGELLVAAEGLNVGTRTAEHWRWAQTSTLRATAAFETEVSYWKKMIDQLATEPDRPTTADWEQKCEKGSCRWWNGREKKWAE
jgi:hypothetical protein